MGGFFCVVGLPSVCWARVCVRAPTHAIGGVLCMRACVRSRARWRRQPADGRVHLSAHTALEHTLGAWVPSCKPQACKDGVRMQILKRGRTPVGLAAHWGRWL